MFEKNLTNFFYITITSNTKGTFYPNLQIYVMQSDNYVTEINEQDNFKYYGLCSEYHYFYIDLSKLNYGYLDEGLLQISQNKKFYLINLVYSYIVDESNVDNLLSYVLKTNEVFLQQSPDLTSRYLKFNNTLQNCVACKMLLVLNLQEDEEYQIALHPKFINFSPVGPAKEFNIPTNSSRCARISNLKTKNNYIYFVSNEDLIVKHVEENFFFQTEVTKSFGIIKNHANETDYLCLTNGKASEATNIYLDIFETNQDFVYSKHDTEYESLKTYKIKNSTYFIYKLQNDLNNSIVFYMDSLYGNLSSLYNNAKIDEKFSLSTAIPNSNSNNSVTLEKNFIDIQTNELFQSNNLILFRVNCVDEGIECLVNFYIQPYTNNQAVDLVLESEKVKLISLQANQTKSFETFINGNFSYDLECLSNTGLEIKYGDTTLQLLPGIREYSGFGTLTGYHMSFYSAENSLWKIKLKDLQASFDYKTVNLGENNFKTNTLPFISINQPLIDPNSESLIVLFNTQYPTKILYDIGKGDITSPDDESNSFRCDNSTCVHNIFQNTRSLMSLDFYVTYKFLLFNHSDFPDISEVENISLKLLTQSNLQIKEKKVSEINVDKYSQSVQIPQNINDPQSSFHVFLINNCEGSPNFDFINLDSENSRNNKVLVSKTVNSSRSVVLVNSTEVGPNFNMFVNGKSKFLFSYRFLQDYEVYLNFRYLYNDYKIENPTINYKATNSSLSLNFEAYVIKTRVLYNIYLLDSKYSNLQQISNECYLRSLQANYSLYSDREFNLRYTIENLPIGR
jgi:hypothetical protein